MRSEILRFLNLLLSINTGFEYLEKSAEAKFAIYIRLVSMMSTTNNALSLLYVVRSLISP